MRTSDSRILVVDEDGVGRDALDRPCQDNRACRLPLPAHLTVTLAVPTFRGALPAKSLATTE